MRRGTNHHYYTRDEAAEQNQINTKNGEERIPARRRPRLLEPLRREPQRAATLITGEGNAASAIDDFLSEANNEQNKNIYGKDKKMGVL